MDIDDPVVDEQPFDIVQAFVYNHYDNCNKDWRHRNGQWLVSS